MDELTKYVKCIKCGGLGFVQVDDSCGTQSSDTCNECQGLGEVPETKANK